VSRDRQAPEAGGQRRWDCFPGKSIYAGLWNSDVHVRECASCADVSLVEGNLRIASWPREGAAFCMAMAFLVPALLAGLSPSPSAHRRAPSWCWMAAFPHPSPALASASLCSGGVPVFGRVPPDVADASLEAAQPMPQRGSLSTGTLLLPLCRDVFESSTLAEEHWSELVKLFSANHVKLSRRCSHVVFTTARILQGRFSALRNRRFS